MPRFVRTKAFEEILSWTLGGMPPILILQGPPGSGKTATMAQVAREYPGRTFWITATPATKLEALFGFWELRAGETVFVEGELLRGLQTPAALIVIDDAHLVAPDLQLLNGIGDETRRFTVPALGRTLEVAEGVRLALLVNPPPRTAASWERDRWIVPDQIRDRARVIKIDESLTPDEEFQIARDRFPKDCPDDIVAALLELKRHLRANGVLETYAPSLRAVLSVGFMLSQGFTLGQAYLESIAYKFVDPDEFAAAIEAFKAKFGADPRDGCATVLIQGGKNAT